MNPLNLIVEFDREDDGRWIAAIPELSGVMAYGTTRDEARRHVHALALHALANRLEIGELPKLTTLTLHDAVTLAEDFIPALPNVTFEWSPDGWWIAELPGFTGAYSQGQTKAEAYRMLLSAIRDLVNAYAEQQND